MKNNNNEWFTPIYVIHKVKKVFDGWISLDACSCYQANIRVKAEQYYTKEDSCLNKTWNGKVFLNPPYSNDILSIVLRKAVMSYKFGDIEELIILTNSGTDTKWNQIIKDGVQAYTIGRISFIDENGVKAGTPGRGQVFTYFGNNRQKFIEEFTKDNFCWIPNVSLLGEF